MDNLIIAVASYLLGYLICFAFERRRTIRLLRRASKPPAPLEVRRRK